VTRTRRALPVVLATIAVGVWCAWGSFLAIASPLAPGVYFVDVGQGDCTLIVAPDGATALIDGGNEDGLALAYLRELGVEHLDVVIATHPHADHIGGLIQVLMSSIDVAQVIANGQAHTTSTYERFLDAIGVAQVPYSEVKRGDVINVGSLSLQVLHPASVVPDDLNTNSIVLRFSLDGSSFLLMADADTMAEASILASGADVSATVLRVGHHGSCGSTSQALCDAVQPQTAIISVGPNSYGHPCAETLDRLARMSVAVRRTDQESSIAISTTLPSPPPLVFAEANGPYSGAVGQEIAFSAAGSSGPISSYSWSFGDGTTQTGTSSATHAYSAAGTYPVTLSVVGDSGKTASDTATVRVNILPPPSPSGHIVINEVEQNPAGTDVGNEWVELFNGTSTPVDIGGWLIVATHGNPVAVAIPYGTIIQPGQFMVFSHSKQWIDNEDEIVELRDSSMRLIDSTCTLKDTAGDAGDGRTWQRVPNAADTDTLGDWQFRSGTRGLRNS
jgi:competence protein ComEC